MRTTDVASIEDAHAATIGSIAVISTIRPMRKRSEFDASQFLHTAVKIGSDTSDNPGWIQVAALGGEITLNTIDQTLEYYETYLPKWTDGEITSEEVELRLYSPGEFSKRALDYIVSGTFRDDVRALSSGLVEN